MAGGIWGDGQRGGIFGAKIDPRLQAELERRAAAQQQAMVEPSLADRWHNSLANRILSAPSKLFGGLVVDPAMDLATLAGDVIHGRQPTMAADPQTGEFHTDPRLADRAMNAAGMLTLGAGAIPAEANSLRMGIKAYHGSPHDFERFDSSKIGTGEGAQAYGHGLYLAENEGVAKDYRDTLTYRDFVNNAQEPRKVGEALFDVEAADGGLIDGKIPFGPTRGLKTREQIADMFASGEASAFDLRPAMQKKINEFMKPKGHMYEVNIAADPEHFLDWDKPLSEQPEAVRKAYAKAVADGDPTLTELLDGSPESFGMMGLFTKSSGAQAYNTLAGQREFGADAAKRLREAGIPGIKYLDQGSRGASEGTRNYVVFDDKLISILKKYGLPISAAGLAALSQLHPQEAQAAQAKQKAR